MDRRQFLHTSAWAAGTFCTGATLAACTTDDASNDATAADADSTAAATALPAIGLQLYTIRSVLDDDFRGTMEQVAEMGYDEVEFAGYYDRSPEDIGALLDDLGLAAPAAHVSLERIREAPEAVIQTATTVGHQYVVCPYLSEADRGSLDDYRSVAEELTRFGERCSDAGLQLAYHNHDFEFIEMDGTLPYDVLLSETDPEHVQMELDLYWVIEAGRDPLDYIERDPARYPLCHVKDRSKDGEMTSVGKGTVDFPALFRAGSFEHYFVEHDNPKAPMESIEIGYRTLNQLTL